MNPVITSLRERAEESGHPLTRIFWASRQPRLASRPVHVVTRKGTSRRIEVDGIDTHPAELIDALFPDEADAETPAAPDVYLFDSAAAMVALARAFSRSEDRDIADAGRVLRLASVLDFAQVFVPVDTALRETFWLPAGMDEDALGDWAEAFGIDAGDEEEVFELMGQVAAAQTMPRSQGALRAVSGPDVAARVLRDEIAILGSARYSGARASISSYNRLSSRAALLQTARLDDPLLREVLVHESEVVPVKLPQALQGPVFEVLVPAGMNFKTGSRVRLFSDVTEAGTIAHAATGTVVGVRRVGEEVGLSIDPLKRSKGKVSGARTASRLWAARARGLSFWMAEEPFGGVTRGITNPRWTGRSLGGAAVPKRPIPSDLMVAGSRSRR